MSTLIDRLPRNLALMDRCSGSHPAGSAPTYRT